MIWSHTGRSHFMASVASSVALVFIYETCQNEQNSCKCAEMSPWLLEKLKILTSWKGSCRIWNVSVGINIKMLFYIRPTVSTYWHADQVNRTGDLPITRRGLSSWATATGFSIFHHIYVGLMAHNSHFRPHNFKKVLKMYACMHLASKQPDISLIPSNWWLSFGWKWK